MRFALLVLYAAGTLSAPVLDERHPKANIKIIECSAKRFRPGTTFEYQYGGETIHKVEGTTEKTTGMQISALVSITQLEGCAFHMKLTNVVLRSKDMGQKTFMENAESAAFKESLEKHDVQFTMEGDTVTSVQPLAAETTEMLNVKRGIISTLQLDETATTETDVNGVCKTKITSEDGLIIKTKALSECSDRTQEEIGIQSSSIKTASNMKPLDSKSTCTYSMDSGEIRKVVCEESHLFRPFSAGYEKSSGAMTIVKQEMKFIQYKAATKVSRPSYTISKPLTFDHTREEESETDTLNEAIEAVMNRLVDHKHLSVKQTSGHEFISLVRMFRKLEEKKMAGVWDKYFDCIASKECGPNDLNLKDLYRQYMLDAIAYCGTPSCVSVVKDVTINGEIAGERANMFLQSIALLAKPTNSMIRDILDIAQKKPSRQVFLTLGTLISRFCTRSPEECNSKAQNAIVQAENFLQTTLGDCSGQDDHERVEEILLTLKAIGNAKRPISAQSAIIRCAMNSKHNNITMSSFDALRGMQCSDSTSEELREFISDENIDADKRIQAFKASMKCSTKKDNLEKLVHQYNIETNKQVASFLWSYFTNIMESTHPDNKMARTWLQEIVKETPLKVTNLSMYQYSKHYEKSLYIDSIQTGATAKADLVFHPDGFLPSTAMFDMTAKVMGVPVDLIQTAVGIDGVETLLENVFGPDGTMPQNFVFKMFNWTLTSEKLKQMANREDAKNRERRAVRRDEMPLVNDIHEAVNMKPAKPSGFMSLKIMGQEVRIMSYDDIYAMIEQVDNMNIIQLLLNMAKGGQKTFSKSVMFLEMTHTVPTGLGLPLKLKLAGSTVGTVDLSGKFDIRNMFWGPGALSINGFVKPSAVVEIAGSMSTESNFLSTGLKVNSNMMVSNILKGSIMYKEGNMLKINLDTPSEPVQLFKFSSTPFMFLNEKTNVIEGVQRVIEKDACLKSQLIGYGMCTSIRMPVAFRNYDAAYFPFTGPAHFGVTLVRGDEKLTTFQFLTTMTKQGNGMGGVIEFSTPNAAYERKLSAKMFYTDVNNEKTVTLSTERFGKTGALKFTYNAISHRTSLEAKNNFFTTKQMITRVVFFNQTSLASQQFGIKFSAEYDWYKFQHVAKYVNKDNKYMLESHTEYAPKKSITAALEYNSLQKKVRAIFDINQVRQAVELIAKLENANNERGLTLMLVHVPTKKTATFYTGYKIEENKKEIMTSLNVMGKSMKNILGWYKNGDIQSIEDFFLVQGKTAKLGASWENKNDETAIQFNADIFGKKALSTVIYSSKNDQKMIDFSTRILEKEISTAILITNRKDDKSVLVRLNSAAKPIEASIGLYDRNNVMTVILAGKAFDNRAELFWRLNTADQYRSSFGFAVNKYAGGVRAETDNGKEHCASFFYRTPEKVEKIAIRACVEYSPSQLDYFVEIPDLKTKLGMNNRLINESGHVNITSQMLYNDKVFCTKTLDLVYKGLSNSALTLGIDCLFRGGLKVYSQDGTIGLVLNAMDNTLELLNKYESPGKITTSILVNGKALPVTTEFTYSRGDFTFNPSFTIKVGEYGLETACNLTYGGGEYGASCKSGITQGQLTLLGLIAKDLVKISESKTSFVLKYGFTLMGIDYIYGFHWSYNDQSNDVKRIHELTVKVQYSTKRMSTVIFTLADSKNMASLNVDVEYIPTKKVHHFITYNKNKQQLDVSVEFLPNMYAKLMSKLESHIGSQLTTKASLDWKNYKRAFTMINSYVNNDEDFMVSTSFASDLSIGLKFNKMSPKSLTLFANAFENNVQLIGVYKEMGVEARFVVNGKNMYRFEGGYDRIATTFRMLAQQQEKVMFDMTSGYNKFMKAFKVAFAGVSKWGGVYVSTKGERTIFNFDVKGKGFAKLIFNRKDMSVSIQSLQYPKFNLIFKLVPKSKTLSMSVKTIKSRVTVNLRADWRNKIAALNGVFNKEKVGMKLFFLKREMIFKVLYAPARTLKARFSYNSNALKMHLQRIIKGKVTNQAVFKYALSTKLSEMMLKWNTDLMKKLEDLIRPVIETATKDVKELLNKIKSQDVKLIKISKEARAKILELLNKVDKAIKNFDYVAARNFITSSSVKVLNELKELAIKILTSLATGLDTIKAKTPEIVQKVRELIKDAKIMYVKLTENMEMKTEVIVKKIKVLIAIVEKIVKEGREMIMKRTNEGRELITKGIKEIRELITKGIKEGQELIKILSADLEKKLTPIIKGVTSVIMNLTDATRPVVEKIIELTKDFEVRGQRLEDIVDKATAIVVKATVEGKRLLNLYIEKVKAILTILEVEAKLKLEELKGRSIEEFNKLQVNIITMLKEAEEYVMKLKVPYTDKTVAQLIIEINVKIIKLVKWLKSLDAKKFIDETKVKIEKLIKANSVILKKQLKELVNKYDELRRYLPEVYREVIDKVVAIFNKYADVLIKDADVLIKEISVFVKPLQKHIMLIKMSINKHFGPLLKTIALPDFFKVLNKIELPNLRLEMERLTNFFIQLLKPLVPLYKNSVRKVRALNLNGFRVGPLFDMQVNEITTKMNRLVIKINNEIAVLRNIVKTKTPNELLTTSINEIVRIFTEIVEYLNTQKVVVMNRANKEVNAAYEKLKVHYKKVTSKSFDDVTEEVLKLSSDGVVVTAGELSNLIKQLVAMDLSEPIWRATRNIDLAGRLEKYEVNEKLRKAIEYAKNLNVTTLVLRTIADIQDLVNLAIRESAIKAFQMYAKIDVVVKYLQSIPKKDYETWLNELAQFTRTTRDVVEMNLKKIYATSRKEAVKSYEIILEKMKKIDTEKYARMVNKEYIATKELVTVIVEKYIRMMNKKYIATKELVKVIVEKSRLVYKDLKQPTIDLFMHYRNTIVPFIEKIIARLEAIFKQLKIKSEKLWNDLKTIWNDLKIIFTSKLAEVEKTFEKAYAFVKAKYDAFLVKYHEFVAKYGHMTWEEVAGKIELAVSEEFEKVKEKIVMYYGKILKKGIALKAKIEAKVLEFKAKVEAELPELKAKIEVKVLELKANVLELYQKAVVIVEEKYIVLKAQLTKTFNEIKTKVMIYYEKYEKVYKAYIKVEVQKLIVRATAIFNEVKAKAIELYNNKIKGKTLKQIYTEIKAFITKWFLKQKEIVQALSEKNYEKAAKLMNKMMNEIQVKVTDEYRKVTLQITTVIVPEVKAIISQIKAIISKIKAANPILEKVMSELMTEAESIINQTLRNTVVLGKEINKAYTPHVIVTKRLVKEYYDIVRVQVPVFIAELEKLIKEGVAKAEQLSKKGVAKAEQLYRECMKKCELNLKELIAQVKELVKTSIEKAVQFYGVSIRKLEMKIKKLIETIKKNEFYIKYVARLEAKLIQLEKLLVEKIEELKTNPTLIKIKAKIERKLSELKVILDEEIERLMANPKFIKLRKEVEMKIKEIIKFIKSKFDVGKKFVATKIAEIKRFLERYLEEQKEFMVQKINEIKWFIQMKFIELKETIAKYETTLQQVLTLLKQMKTSGKFSVEKLQMYITPYLRDAGEVALQSVMAVPQLAEQAIVYFVEAPEDSFWYGVEVWREVLGGAYLRLTTITAKEIEVMLLEFYMNVVALSKDIYAKTTDEWTKKTVLKLRDFIKQVIVKISTECAKLREQYKSLPALLKAYYEEAVAILKKLLKEKLATLKATLKEKLATLKEALATLKEKLAPLKEKLATFKLLLTAKIVALEVLLKEKLPAEIKLFVKDTIVLVKAYTTKAIEVIREVIREYWGASTLKTIVDNEMWTEIAGEISHHELSTLAMDINEMVMVKMTMWIEELKPMVKEAIKNLEGTLKKEYAALKEKTVKMLMDLKIKALELKVKLEDKVLELKVKLEDKVLELKVKAVELYKEGMEKYKAAIIYAKKEYGRFIVMALEKYNWIIKTVTKIFEETTIEEMVTFVQEQYKLAVQKFNELKVKYMKELKAVYEEYKAVYEEYKLILSNLSFKDFIKMIKMEVMKLIGKLEVVAKPYFEKFEKLFNKYKAIVLSKYEKLSDVVIAQYKKLSAEIIAQYKKLSAEVIAKYKKLSAEIIAKYEKLPAEIIAKYEKLSAEIIAKYEKISAEIIVKYGKYFYEIIAKYEKISAEIIAKYGKYFNEIIAKYEKLSAEIIAKYETYSTIVIAKYKILLKTLKTKYAEAQKMYKRYKVLMIVYLGAGAHILKEDIQWIKFEITTKLDAFKKMTIKETIKALKNIPKEIELFLLQKYKDIVAYVTVKYEELILNFNKLKVKLVAEYAKVLAKVEELKGMLIAKFIEKVKPLIKELQAEIEKVIKMLKPYLQDASKVYYRIENEITESAIFAWRYYDLEEKYNKVKKFIISEIIKIIEAKKKSLPMVTEALKKYADDYKEAMKMSAFKYQSLLEIYARDTEDFTRTTVASAGKVAVKTGDNILRAIHSGLVFLDTLEKETVMKQLRIVVEYIKEHIKIIREEGLVIVKLIHPDIKPALTHYANVVKHTAKKTIKQLKTKGREMLTKIEAELPILKEKIRQLKEKIQEAVMESTSEIRRDLNISIKINKNIAIRLYNVVSRIVEQRYATSVARFNVLKEKVLAVGKQWKTMSEAFWKKFMRVMKFAYGKAEVIILDISNAPSPKVMYEKINYYAIEGTETFWNIVLRYEPLIAPKLAAFRKELSTYLMTLQQTYEMLREKYPVKELADKLIKYLKSQEITMERLDQTVDLVKKFLVATTKRLEKFATTAFDVVKEGIDTKVPQKIFKRWVNLAKEEIMNIVKFLKEIKKMANLCKDDAELCKLIDEALEVHKILLKKYVGKVAVYVSSGKAHIDRAIRKINTGGKDKYVGEQYHATAMIMANHILTFDNKLYDMVKFMKTKKGSPSPCSYLLARDFLDKKFTLSKLDNALIVETPHMTVKIREDGQVRTTVGNRLSFGLPVESRSSKCMRLDNLILCHFKDQGVKITVDLKNFFTTISIDGWHRGKTQGLLGTYNNEDHDDWRLPNNKITKNINEFANAYELSGNPKCQLNLETDNTKVCDGKTSKMCARYFASDDSPFARVFDAADPTPFMKACAQETKCKRNNRKAHCSIVAAYVAMLRVKGVWVPQVNECMAEKGHSVNEEWIQKPMKAIDVVVMVSQHRNMRRLKKSIADTILNLHKLLKRGKYNVRYALVGFGGKGVHEAAHSHPLGRGQRGQSVFGYAFNLKREIKSMPFEGEGPTTNDGYHAILKASTLKFRPAAEKVFIMFNSQPHSSHETGPSFDETRYILARESNAPLFVFDTVNFPKFGKGVGRVIGETERKLYTSKNVRGITSKDLVMPASEFKQLVLLSKGGLFSNVIKNPLQVASSLHDAVLNWVKTDMTLCKRCTLRSSWTGQSRAICVSDRTANC